MEPPPLISAHAGSDEPPPPPPPYEFDATQEALIHDLGLKMSFVGKFLIIMGLLNAASGLRSLPSRHLPGAATAIIGIAIIGFGFWTNSAARSFKLVAKTSGRDIENLMMALGELRKLYGVQYWLLILALAFVILAIAVTLISSFFRG